MGLGLLVLAQALRDYAETMMGGGKARAKRHRLPEALPRWRKLTALMEHDPQIEMGLEIIRIGGDRHAVAAFCFVEPCRPVVRHALGKHVWQTYHGATSGLVPAVTAAASGHEESLHNHSALAKAAACRDEGKHVKSTACNRSELFASWQQRD
jgi:hypothetical protein